jgi:hypothetical protein
MRASRVGPDDYSPESSGRLLVRAPAGHQAEVFADQVRVQRADVQSACNRYRGARELIDDD